MPSLLRRRHQRLRRTAAANAPAPEQAASNLTIKITGIRNAKGRINIALSVTGRDFQATYERRRCQRVEIDPQTLVPRPIQESPQGAYAAAVLHDENMTGKMDFDAQGIPQEG